MTRSSAQDASLGATLAGVELRNPVLLAAGTAGYLDELADASLDLRAIGGVVTKSITGEPRAGNPSWRVIETHRGMMNAIGLANVGSDAFARDHGSRVAGVDTTIIGSIAGSSVEEYVRVAAMFETLDAIPIVEANVSCPNVKSGTAFGDSTQELAALVRSVRDALPTTRLFVKLAPTSHGPPGETIVDLARAALHAGADGLTIANTVPAMAIDVRTRRPRLASVTGGLSGPAIHPIAVRLVHAVYRGAAREHGAPIIGVGGVMTWEDAAELILAGASAIAMGTALFVDPRAPARVVRGLAGWVRAQGESSIANLVGAVSLGDPGDA